MKCVCYRTTSTLEDPDMCDAGQCTKLLLNIKKRYLYIGSPHHDLRGCPCIGIFFLFRCGLKCQRPYSSGRLPQITSMAAGRVGCGDGGCLDYWQWGGQSDGSPELDRQIGRWFGRELVWSCSSLGAILGWLMWLQPWWFWLSAGCMNLILWWLEAEIKQSANVAAISNVARRRNIA